MDSLRNAYVTWQEHTVWLNGWVFVYELSGCGFESRCCHLTSGMAPASSKEFFDIQVNYRVWIHSETRTWHGNNIQCVLIFMLKLQAASDKHVYWKQNYVLVKYVLSISAEYSGSSTVLLLNARKFSVLIERFLRRIIRDGLTNQYLRVKVKISQLKMKKL